MPSLTQRRDSATPNGRNALWRQVPTKPVCDVLGSVIRCLRVRKNLPFPKKTPIRIGRATDSPSIFFRAQARTQPHTRKFCTPLFVALFGGALCLSLQRDGNALPFGFLKPKRQEIPSGDILCLFRAS